MCLPDIHFYKTYFKVFHYWIHRIFCFHSNLFYFHMNRICLLTVYLAPGQRKTFEITEGEELDEWRRLAELKGIWYSISKPNLDIDDE